MQPPDELLADLGELLDGAATLHEQEPQRPVETVTEADLPLGGLDWQI